MATQRYISTTFWEDKWIRSLDPSERYLYMYLLTNPLTSIAGIYQITMDRIAFDTGYDERTLVPMLDRFADSGKAFFYDDEWIILPSWPKHQRVRERDNCRKGIDTILSTIPDDVFSKALSVGYKYKYLNEIDRGLEAPSSPFKPLGSPLDNLARPSDYLDLDTDTDLDTDRDIEASSIQPKWETMPTLCKQVLVTFETHYGSILPNPHKQIDAINKLVKMSADRGDPEVVLKAMMLKLKDLKDNDRSKNQYWKLKPFLPTTLVSQWAGVWEAAKIEATDEPEPIDWDEIDENGI